MEYELYHMTPRNGYSKQSFKYVRKEWKNGRWVYYYDESKKEGKTGASSSTSDRSKVSRNVGGGSFKENNTSSKFDRAVGIGKQIVERANDLWTTNIKDLPKSIKHVLRPFK